MRRANGDWFVVAAQERLRVPLFHSSHDGTMARLRNFGMLLFEPVALDTNLLKEIRALSGGSHVEFSLVNDPFAPLTRGKALKLADVEITMANLVRPATAAANGNGFGNPRTSSGRHNELRN